jgi:hypothetical protein
MIYWRIQYGRNQYTGRCEALGLQEVKILANNIIVVFINNDILDQKRKTFVFTSEKADRIYKQLNAEATGHIGVSCLSHSVCSPLSLSHLRCVFNTPSRCQTQRTLEIVMNDPILLAHRRILLRDMMVSLSSLC